MFATHARVFGGRGGKGAPRLLLVEDHAAFRAALALLLNLQPGMQVVAEYGPGNSQNLFFGTFYTRCLLSPHDAVSLLQ